MKVAVLLACTFIITSKELCGSCASIKAPLELISLDDVTSDDRKTLDFLNYLSNRSKRSHEDPLDSLKASIGQGIKSKLGLIAKGSASASGHFSTGSSHHDYHSYDHHKSFDFWTLKKSILNTLLQAVKAIKGGVIAIKGQLIKGSGYLISAKGKLISAKGEAITNLGKNIATSAVLSPTKGEAYSHHHHDEYGSPSAPGPEYDVPDHYHHHHPHEDKPNADHAGILIIKKIPKHHHHDHDDHHHVPEFKPIGHKGPGWGEIIGKFFKASTSLKPGEPAPFGDEHFDHYDHDHHHHFDDHDHHHHFDDHDHHHVDHDHHHHFDDHDHHHHDDHDHQSHHIDDHHHHHNFDHPSQTQHNFDHDHHHFDQDHHHTFEHHIHDETRHDLDKPHSPFEEAPSFLNLAEYASESKGGKPVVTAKPDPPKPDLNDFNKPQPQPIKYDEIRPLPTAFTNLGFDTSHVLTDTERPKLLIGSLDNQPNTNFPPYPQDTSQFGSFPNSGFDSGVKYLSPPVQNFQNFKYQTYENSPAFSNKRPSRKRPVYSSPKFMKSVLYERGPGGPKRI